MVGDKLNGLANLELNGFVNGAGGTTVVGASIEGDEIRVRVESDGARARVEVGVFVVTADIVDVSARENVGVPTETDEVEFDGIDHDDDISEDKSLLSTLAILRKGFCGREK